MNAIGLVVHCIAISKLILSDCCGWWCVSTRVSEIVVIKAFGSTLIETHNKWANANPKALFRLAFQDSSGG